MGRHHAGGNLLNGLAAGDFTLGIYPESYTNGVNAAGNMVGTQTGTNLTASPVEKRRLPDGVVV